MSQKYEKRESCFIFFSSLCACGFIKWSFDHRAKVFLSKIRKNLAQVRNWLENENFNFKIFLKKFRRHSKKQFFQLSRKVFAKRWHFFCSMSKNDWKKRISSQKSGSPQNIFTDTGRAVFTTSPGNFQREADFFSLNVRKLQNKYLIKKSFASKRFYGHVASIFDDPIEKLKTKGWISSTKKTHETSSDERLLIRGFLWTLRLQIP